VTHTLNLKGAGLLDTKRIIAELEAVRNRLISSASALHQFVMEQIRAYESANVKGNQSIQQPRQMILDMDLDQIRRSFDSLASKGLVYRLAPGATLEEIRTAKRTF
jgi:hypothetical protein